MFLRFVDRVHGPLKGTSQHLVLWIPTAMGVGLAVGVLFDLSSRKSLVVPLTT